jgi:hypothetical protein
MESVLSEQALKVTLPSLKLREGHPQETWKNQNLRSGVFEGIIDSGFFIILIVILVSFTVTLFNYILLEISRKDFA